MNQVPLLVFLAIVGGASRGFAASTEAVTVFLEKHCYTCHDEETQKGDFRADKLSLVMTAPEAAKQWGRVLARLEAGEMPPPKREQPPEAELEPVVVWCKSMLAAEASARRQSSGRAHVRRLSRLEYENTVHDLLGVEIPLRGLLPEDDRADGFDTTARALGISSVHVHGYMAAADVALRATVAHTAQPPTLMRRFTYDHPTETGFVEKQHRTRRPMFVRSNGEMLFYSEPGEEHPAFLKQFSELTRQAPGRYRVRVSARALNMDGKSLALGIRMASIQRRLGFKRLGWFDLPSSQPTKFEFVAWFSPGDTIIVEPYRLNDARRWRGFSQYAPEEPGREPEGPGVGVAWIEVEGPLHESWPPPGHRLLFGDVPIVPFNPLSPDEATGTGLDAMRPRYGITPVSVQPGQDARNRLNDFLSHAFRRPVDETDCAPYMEIVREHLARRESLESALLAAYRTALCSPDFLFRVEMPGLLGDHALAARLSYFLWRTAPDAALRAAADRGELRAPEGLRRETERLLDSPRSDGFVADFLDQWLHLREMDATMPDQFLFPEFYVQEGARPFREDGLLIHSMIAESRLFFSELLRRDLSLLKLIDADFTFLNDRLADYYHLPPVQGSAMRRVPLPPGHVRGGVLTQASVLKVTADGTRTSPIVRGVWVLENLLGRKPPPPPSDAGNIDPDTRGSTTIREQLAKHQRNESCATCHRQIDPPGFALEGFDPAGQWREHYRTRDSVEKDAPNRPQPSSAPGQNLRVRDILGPWSFRAGMSVDASGVMPDGRRFSDVREFKQLLARQPHAVARSLVTKLVTYATGQPVEPGDTLALDAIVGVAREKDYGMRSLIHALVQSELFRGK